MSNSKPFQLSYTDTLLALRQLQEQHDRCSLEPDKHRIVVENGDQHSVKVHIKLPLIYPGIRMLDGSRPGEPYSPLPRAETLQEYLNRVPEEKPSYLLLLMEAGQASLGFVEDDELIHHKVIRKYMVRKKQGKAQLTHLRQKGKSRLGSRIRLANSIAFFEEINEKVEEWDIIDDAEHILYSCTSRLWGELFRSSVPCPFSLDDPRVRKLPMDVRTPTLEELERVVTAVQFSEWSGNLPSFLNEPLMSKA